MTEQDTPIWQLEQQLKSSLLLEIAHRRDAERYITLADAAAAKAAAYQQAIDKLRS